MRIHLRLAIVFSWLSMAAARLHYSCTCHNGDSYHWKITSLACERYAWHKYKWGLTKYDTALGRCLSEEPQMKAIAGKEWESICKEVAKGGYTCSNGYGRCIALADEVKGWCD